MVADQNQVEENAYITATDQNGDPFEIEGLVIPIVVANAEVAGLLAAYDPSNQYSPSAEDSRVIARVVMDSLKRYIEGA